MKQAMWALIVKGKSGLGKERMFKFNKFHNDYRVRGRCECWAQKIRHGQAEPCGLPGRMCLFSRFDMSRCQIFLLALVSVLPSVILIGAQRRLEKEPSPDANCGLPCIGHVPDSMMQIMMLSNQRRHRTLSSESRTPSNGEALFLTFHMLPAGRPIESIRLVLLASTSALVLYRKKVGNFSFQILDNYFTCLPTLTCINLART